MPNGRRPIAPYAGVGQGIGSILGQLMNWYFTKEPRERQNVLKKAITAIDEMTHTGDPAQAEALVQQHPQIREIYKGATGKEWPALLPGTPQPQPSGPMAVPSTGGPPGFPPAQVSPPTAAQAPSIPWPTSMAGIQTRGMHEMMRGQEIPPVVAQQALGIPPPPSPTERVTAPFKAMQGIPSELRPMAWQYLQSVGAAPGEEYPEEDKAIPAAYLSILQRGGYEITPEVIVTALKEKKLPEMKFAPPPSDRKLTPSQFLRSFGQTMTDQEWDTYLYKDEYPPRAPDREMPGDQLKAFLFNKSVEIGVLTETDPTTVYNQLANETYDFTGYTEEKRKSGTISLLRQLSTLAYANGDTEMMERILVSITQMMGITYEKTGTFWERLMRTLGVSSKYGTQPLIPSNIPPPTRRTKEDYEKEFRR